MKTASAAFAVSSLVVSASAFAYNEGRTFATVQFTNNFILQGRVDPIISPGKQSSHVHHVLGGSNFGMSSTGEDLLKSNCTNANVKGDNSNYWFPSMYFQDPKTGELESVELFYPKVYYFFEKTHDTIKAFPPGLSMVIGDPMKRTPPSSVEEVTVIGGDNKPISNIGITCPRDENTDQNGQYVTGPSWPVDSDGSMAGMGNPKNAGAGVGFPFRSCDGYAAPMRMDLHFPSCYKPSVGLTDYKNNMAWPKDVNGYQDCEEGEIHVPHLFMEVYWDTLKFADRWDHQSGKGPQPFVLASGDRTGFGWHADFMAGWDTDLLQSVIDNCDTGNNGMLKCPGVEENKDHCSIEPEIQEQVDGKLQKLPGNNPITGWGVGSDAVTQPDNGNTGSSSGSDEADSNQTVEKPSSSSTSSPVPSATQDPVSSKSDKPSGTCGGMTTVYKTITITTGLDAQPTETVHARRHAHSHFKNRRGSHH